MCITEEEDSFSSVAELFKNAESCLLSDADFGYVQERDLTVFSNGYLQIDAHSQLDLENTGLDANVCVQFELAPTVLVDAVQHMSHVFDLTRVETISIGISSAESLEAFVDGMRYLPHLATVDVTEDVCDTLLSCMEAMDWTPGAAAFRSLRSLRLVGHDMYRRDNASRTTGLRRWALVLKRFEIWEDAPRTSFCPIRTTRTYPQLVFGQVRVGGGGGNV